ncbi:acyl-CoA carboxylase subunit beta [Sneathiella chinensis]|uniref:Acetyl-CoA carboxylase carboxyltransferase subunit n=2 Tax=Alphaproteobacteria TaxID=28211 RepID=A0ABQ5U1F0_9PROT|nr:carboxyl transferase domain-containing protein [Sneathiella chinensis]GLQ05495.1 acetyl-CoA carboxylase carboxyltransferase subunit [Sneathiella chinensis]
MPVITSEIDTNSEAFRTNREAMQTLISGFRDLEQKVRDASNAKKDKFEKRGQLLPRQRIALLLDKGAPFLQLSTLAGLGMHDDDGKDDVLGGGLIAGIGYVSGIRCMVLASDSAIKGGTVAPMGLEKSLRAQEIILKNKLPVVNLVESGGANLLYQSEIFVKGGQGFANQARMSAAGIPQITVVHGSSTAGGAYQPGLSDYVIMVRGGAKVFLAGPPLLKAATGEVATDEDLGGAEMHSTVSGVSEYLAESDADGIRIAREIMAALPWNENGPARPARDYQDPLYDIDELMGVVPTDYRKPYDVREVIARIVDGSEFLTFKELYGVHTVCGHARIEGQPVGIIGNNGPIDADGATKAAQFIQLCSQSGTPLLFLQNTTGYMVGTEAEQAGIVKHGSKMIQAVTNATVPKLTLHIGASFGAGNYGMCGRSFDPRFIFAWPNNRVAVMGGEQAAKVMSIVTEEKFRKMGQEPDRDALQQMEQGIIRRMDKESTALFATARLWDDGLIDPRDTRKVLSYCLSIAGEADARQTNKNTFGIGRM